MLQAVCMAHQLLVTAENWLCAQEVMETYRRSNVHLAYSLSSFLPVVSISCSELVVAVPMRNSSQLHSKQLQPEPGSKHELVLVVEGVHLGVRWGVLSV